MAALFESILTASFHGSIVILAVLILRLALRKAPKKYICWLWLLAGLRLLMPFQVQSELSLQPRSPVMPQVPPKLVLLAWIAVAAGFLVYSLASYIALRKKVRFAVKIPGGFEADGIETAFILGFIKPKIYIPMGMDDNARKHILAHERTHLDKGDHWIKMIGFLALALHWFNPLVWAAYILLCKDIEMACDERVVQFMELSERKAYSAALLDCSTNHSPYMASPVAFGEVSVKSRILSILNYRKPSFWVGLLSVAAVGFVTLCFVTSPTKEPEVVVMAPAEPTVAEEAEIAPPPAEPVSPWGLSILAEPLSNTTMKLYTGVDVDGIPWDGTPIQKDDVYWLEGWNGTGWEKLPMLIDNPSYDGSYRTELSKDNVHRRYITDDLDWTLLYGPLPQGYYRIGTRPERQGVKKDHYAQFRIWTNTLTGEKAQAIERCTNAVDMLLQKDGWSVTLCQSNQFGESLPVRTVYKAGSKGRVDSYIGDYCYNIYYCDISETCITDWAEDFRLKGNCHISFPEGESSVSGDEIKFLATWTDLDGTPCRQTNSYTFGADGSLAGAWQTTIQGEKESRKSFTVGLAHWGDTISQVDIPKDSTESTADSPWGLFFRIDDDYLSPSGGEVWFSAGERVGVIPYTTDGEYWLEKKNADKWEKLPANGLPRWDDRTYRLRSQTTVNWVDWTPYYGELEPGLYRMGKRFYDEEESIIQYAEFLLYPQGDTIGEGGEEAIARVNAALERAKAGNYHIVEKTSGGFHTQEGIQMAYWKYDGACVTDYYHDQSYSHSSYVDDPQDTLFYDQWMWVANWNEPRNQVFFAKGASRISQEEITFATALTGNDSLQPLFWYSVFFDEQDNITRIERLSPGYVYGEDDRKTTFCFEDTSGEEITAWVQEIKAQQ